MGFIAITNNDMFVKNMQGNKLFEEIVYINSSVIDVLLRTKDYIRNNYVLVLNPLTGSTFPNEAAYKTVVLSKNARVARVIDFSSLNTISETIKITEKFMNSRTRSIWMKNDLLEFRKIDLIIIESWLNKIYLKTQESFGEK